jgi:hypothetical protein
MESVISYKLLDIHSQIMLLWFMPVRGRQALRQDQVEQIAAALGMPPHKLTDELLEKPSVLALIGA